MASCVGRSEKVSVMWGHLDRSRRRQDWACRPLEADSRAQDQQKPCSSPSQQHQPTAVNLQAPGEAAREPTNPAPGQWAHLFCGHMICSHAWTQLGYGVRPFFVLSPREGFPGGLVVKNPPFNAGDTSLIPGLGSFLEKEMATLSSILGNPMDGGAWQATVLGITKPRTQLRD